MKTSHVVSALLLLATAALAAPEIGQPAPDFKLKDLSGKEHSLSEYKGKYVVLEWVNFGCPFVRKHYETQNMQKLQKDETAKGVVWLSICSSGPGKQGNFPPAEAEAKAKEFGAAPTAYLIDEDGTVGHAYDARTTPDMFVINPQGVLIYEGAIDDQPTPDHETVAIAKNYVQAALTDAMANKPVSPASTKSYGCSVKY